MKLDISLVIVWIVYFQLSMYTSHGNSVLPSKTYSCQLHPYKFPPYPTFSSPCKLPPCQSVPRRKTSSLQSQPRQCGLPKMPSYQLTQSASSPKQSTCPSTQPNTSCSDCRYPQSCVNATTIPYSIKKVAHSSPLHVVALEDTPARRAGDDSCYTYIDAGYGIFINFRVIVTNTGGVLIRTYLVTDVTGFPGRSILIGTYNLTGNPFLVGYEYVIAGAKIPCDTTAIYRCNVYQTCRVSDDIGNLSNILLLSNSPNASSSCVNKVQQDVYRNKDGYNTTQFIHPPFNKPFKCICSFNGINVINRKKISDLNCMELM